LPASMMSSRVFSRTGQSRRGTRLSNRGRCKSELAARKFGSRALNTGNKAGWQIGRRTEKRLVTRSYDPLLRLFGRLSSAAGLTTLSTRRV
jgi:hypothetical protein